MTDPQKNTSRYLNIFLLVIALIGYGLLGYNIERSQSLWLVGSFSVLFLIYIWQLVNIRQDKDVVIASCFSLVFRIGLLLAIPNLSDDFYRFIWDGRLLNAGINPFINLPSYFIDNPGLAPAGINKELFEGLNSPDYFTIYPPVNQLIFWLATWISPNSVLGSVVVIRSFILLAEIGNIYLIKKLLVLYKLPGKNLLIYALNPLVILELTGNLHFEAVMIFFILWSIYLLKTGKINISALSFALAICTKLIPLIFLPLIISKLTILKTIRFYVITGFVTLLCFLPLLSQAFFDGLQNSFSLYFQKFEFNASVYYLLRAYGYHLVGYNIIAYAGSFLALISFVLILHYAFYEAMSRKNLLPFSMMWVLLIYLALTTTLHPWYILPMVAYSAFTNYRFPVLWTFLIILTYLNYSPEGFTENLLIVFLEYTLVFMYLIYEWVKNYPETKGKIILSRK